MGMTKQYLLEIQHHCSDHLFGQEAVEWAIITGRVKLTGELQTDLRTIMGQPGRPETGLYDEIVTSYQAQCREHGDSLVALYESAGLFDEILRPVRSGGASAPEGAGDAPVAGFLQPFGRARLTAPEAVAV